MRPLASIALVASLVIAGAAATTASPTPTATSRTSVTKEGTPSVPEVGDAVYRHVAADAASVRHFLAAQWFNTQVANERHALELLKAAADAQQAVRARAHRLHRRTPRRSSSAATGGSVWDRLAQCESGGNWAINTGNGYHGGVQIGGHGNVERLSKDEQIRIAIGIQRQQGWRAWPVCSRKIGLR